jgi:hypothetical protein
MQALDVIFRDDCHHTITGSAFVASIVAEALERCIVTAQGTSSPQVDRGVTPVRLLPPVMDAAHWTGGQGAWGSKGRPSTTLRIPRHPAVTLPCALLSTPTSPRSGVWLGAPPGI